MNRRVSTQVPIDTRTAVSAIILESYIICWNDSVM